MVVEDLEVPNCVLTCYPDVVVLPDSNTVTTSGGESKSGGSTSTDTTFKCDTINLHKNSKGEDVKKLQTILKAKGYYTRSIDGDYGKYTVAAVKKLQNVQGNTPDGVFGPKTCKKLQSSSVTSNSATNTENKKSNNYIIKDIKVSPSISWDAEGLSHEVTLQTDYSTDKIIHMRVLQKTLFNMSNNNFTFSHKGYINNIKLLEENDKQMLEIKLVGYITFLEQSITIEKTAKKSELIKELCKLAGIKSNINLEGLTDTEFTLKSVAETSNTTSDSGLKTISGNDCTDTYSISTRSYDINSSSKNVIGNSNANYATDTSNMTGKQAIMDIYNRFVYKGYMNNRTCPRNVWKSSGSIRGNCADISRLVMCVGQVHGMNVGIHHMSGHYYNLIEVDGKTYRFDCCCKSSGSYKGEVTNNLTKRGGPWA